MADVQGYFRKVPAGGISAELIAGGSGSGLDADTLDGLHASAFMGAGVDD